MVYIIILNYNGWRDTIECLESLLKIDNCNFKIIVIDNLSTDDSLSKIISWSKDKFLIDSCTIESEFDLMYIKHDFSDKLSDSSLGAKSYSFYQSKQNGGYSAGNNNGIRHAMENSDAEYIWILNNDTIVDKNSLGEMLNVYALAEKRKLKLGIVGCKLLYYNNPNVIQCLGGVLYNPYIGIIRQVGNNEADTGTIKYNIKPKVSYIPGTSMLVSVNFVKDVGLLSEEYFLYFEELDWTKRGEKRGWQIDYTLEAFVLHKEGGTINKDNYLNKSALSDYCFLRSKLLYTRKYENSFCKVTIFLGVILSFLLRIYKGQFDRILTMARIVFNPNSRFFLPKID
ncbi:glycosyltransferase family 2 protein [Spirosoma radiotolerans]|uniref:Glycosyltransferase 2-like domain-containing protein n=1 Tax=Spirosoma radiotolerans TaxID=1379870 RepID=A0A0E3V4U1_9BACT|nr:glycosyltransferase family 2 protein [Spirosoma radiotolerans]AKD53612.1 hypothetical protein SD10_00530 [Spirosoma radiotolerans]